MAEESGVLTAGELRARLDAVQRDLTAVRATLEDVAAVTLALGQAEAEARQIRTETLAAIRPLAKREEARVAEEGRLAAAREAKEAQASTERSAAWARLLSALSSLTRAENLRTLAIILALLAALFRPDLAAMYSRIFTSNIVPTPVVAPPPPAGATP